MNDASDGTWVAIGRVGRPHGRDGSFVVEHASEAGEHFEIGALLYVDRVRARIVASKRAGGRIVIQLGRETTRGDRLELPRSDLPRLEDGEYYVFELVGLRVETDDGQALGTIADVVPGPANDVIELEDGELLPLVRACVLDVDAESGRVVVARSFAPDG